MTLAQLAQDGCRGLFPLLDAQPDLVYLDNAATTHIPRPVLDAMEAFETASRANIHRGIYPLAEEASQAYESSRETVARFFGASPEETVFTHGATEALNMAILGWGIENLQADDIVLVDVSCHHSAIVPWLMLQKRIPIDIRFIKLDETGALDLACWKKLLRRRPKAATLTHASNVTGLACNLEALTREAHACGCTVFADCAQSAAHREIDFQGIGVDFAAVSAHKLYGPFGIGALFIRKSMMGRTSPLIGGGGMVASVTTEGFTTLPGPSGFEAGTPNITGAVGFAAACTFLESLDRQRVVRKNRELCNQMLDVLTALPGMRVLGTAEPDKRDSTISFLLDGIHPHDLADAMGSAGVAVRAGHHCAMPLHKELNVPASVRASFGVYSSQQDVNRFASALMQAEGELR